MEKDVPASGIAPERTVCGRGTRRAYIDNDGHERPICEFCEQTNPDFIGATFVRISRTGPAACSVMVVDA